MSFFFRHVERPVIIINKYLDPVTLPYIYNIHIHRYTCSGRDGRRLKNKHEQQ